MAMRACDKCLENNWAYKVDEAWITATCNACAHEVTWERRRPAKVEKEGDTCKCMRGKVVRLVLKLTAKKKRKAYYYSECLKCVTCHRMYYFEEHRVRNKTVCEENIQSVLRHDPPKAREYLKPVSLSLFGET